MEALHGSHEIVQGVIKKYGECINKKKIITVKDTLPLMPLKILPLTSNTLIPLFLPLSEAVLKSNSVNVFSYAVVAASMS
jgi:hypothetical protein